MLQETEKICSWLYTFESQYHHGAIEESEFQMDWGWRLKLLFSSLEPFVLNYLRVFEEEDL